MKQIKREYRKLDFSPYDKSLPSFELYSIDGQSYDFTDNLSFADNQDGVYIFLTSVPELDMEKMDVTPMCTMRYCGKTNDLRHRFDQHHHKDDLKVLNPLYIAVAYCSGETEITELENKLLDTFHFEFNEPSTNKGTNDNLIKAVRLSTP